MTDDEAIYDARLELIDFVIQLFHDVPEAPFVADLLGDDVMVPREESINDHLDAGFEALARFRADNADADPAALAESLTVAYTETFVGPRPPVLPHETHYREDTEFIGEGLAQVEASYGAAGWAPPEDYGEENDHVAVEFAFLRHLVARQRAGEEETVGFERVFLDEHLSTWIEAFAADVREECDEPLYRAGALIAAGVADFEDELVAQML